MISVLRKANTSATRSILLVSEQNLRDFSAASAGENVVGFELALDSVPGRMLYDHLFPSAYLMGEIGWSGSQSCINSKLPRYFVASSVMQPGRMSGPASVSTPSFVVPSLFPVWLRYLLMRNPVQSSSGSFSGALPIVSPELEALNLFGKDDVSDRLVVYQAELKAIVTANHTASANEPRLVVDLSKQLLDRANAYVLDLEKVMNVSCFPFALTENFYDGMTVTLCEHNFFALPTPSTEDTASFFPANDVALTTVAPGATVSAVSDRVGEIVIIVLVGVGLIAIVLVGIIMFLIRRRRQKVADAASAAAQWTRDSFSSEIADSSLGDRPATSSIEEGEGRVKGDSSSVQEEGRGNALFMATAIQLNSEPSQRDTESLD